MLPRLIRYAFRPAERPDVGRDHDAPVEHGREPVARVAALQDSVKAIQTLIREEQARAALPLDDSVMAGGIVMRFPSVALSTSDRDALREGIAQASSSLARQFGDDATQLLTGEATLLNVYDRLGAALPPPRRRPKSPRPRTAATDTHG